MATSIKITALSDIGNNIAPTTLVPVVNMTGTPETQKSTLQNLGNLILAGAGGANFVAVGAATTAGTVTTAAQPNITSVGTLTALSVTGNVNSGNINTGRVVATGNISASGANLGNSASANYFVGNGSFLTGITVAAGNVTGLGNIATINLDGNSSNILYGNGAWSAAPTASLVGDGGNLSNINAANINGVVAESNLTSLINVQSVNNNFSYHVVLSAGAGDKSLHIDADDNLQYNPADGTLTAVRMDATYFVGNGDFLHSLNGANVLGQVSYAGVANSVAAANVSGLGNIATLNLNGNSQTWLAGNGVFANIAIPSVGNIAVINLDGNVSNVLTGNGTFVALPVINANTVVWSTAPVSNTSTGTAGQAAYDSGGNLFVCVATDTWAKFTGTTSW